MLTPQLSYLHRFTWRSWLNLQLRDHAYNFFVLRFMLGKTYISDMTMDPNGAFNTCHMTCWLPGSTVFGLPLKAQWATGWGSWTTVSGWKAKSFSLCMAFLTSVYFLWCERNVGRHNECWTTHDQLTKNIRKAVNRSVSQGIVLLHTTRSSPLTKLGRWPTKKSGPWQKILLLIVF